MTPARGSHVPVVESAARQPTTRARRCGVPPHVTQVIASGSSSSSLRESLVEVSPPNLSSCAGAEERVGI